MVLENTFLFVLYDPPENSTFSKKLDYNILELIESDVIKYSEKRKIFLTGDFNARTATENDFIQLDSDKHIPLYNNYVSDQNLLPRDNQDKILNTRGDNSYNYAFHQVYVY